jgi:hypothetical protein
MAQMIQNEDAYVVVLPILEDVYHPCMMPQPGHLRYNL